MNTPEQDAPSCAGDPLACSREPHPCDLDRRLKIAPVFGNSSMKHHNLAAIRAQMAAGSRLDAHRAQDTQHCCRPILKQPDPSSVINGTDTPTANASPEPAKEPTRPEAWSRSTCPDSIAAQHPVVFSAGPTVLATSYRASRCKGPCGFTPRRLRCRAQTRRTLVSFPSAGASDQAPNENEQDHVQLV